MRREIFKITQNGGTDGENQKARSVEETLSFMKFYFLFGRKEKLKYFPWVRGGEFNNNKFSSLFNEKL